MSDDPFKDWPWKLGDHKEPRTRAVALVPEVVTFLREFTKDGQVADMQDHWARNRMAARNLLAGIFEGADLDHPRKCGVCGQDLDWFPPPEQEKAACSDCTVQALRQYGRIP